MINIAEHTKGAGADYTRQPLHLNTQAPVLSKAAWSYARNTITALDEDPDEIDAVEAMRHLNLRALQQDWDDDTPAV